ncbi:NPFFR2 [Mytilus coruscus]|uniref:NPFFR2 n=1 Tax=Mytilus coruscus TaxID=42192 RepID=A0A6J8EWZ3_MYTCO|nr:NPFFR2 [Mytilus coruscus]
MSGFETNVSNYSLDTDYFGTSPMSFERTTMDILDSRLHPYPKEFRKVPLWEASLKIFVYSLMILVSVIGNILIILVVAKNKRMRTTTNYYIVNLAASDLLVTLSCTWVNLVSDLSEGWILGSFFCKVNSFAQVTSVVSSILSLTLVAYDRFFGIVYAMKAHIIERSAKYSLIVIWVFSITVALPMVLFRRLYERHWKNHVELWCDDDWSLGALQGTSEPTEAFHRPARMTYYTIICLILFIFPIVAMIGAYCGIIRTLWLNKIPGERLTHDISGQMKMKRKVVIMLILILTVFSVCWFPLQISILYSEYRSDPKMMGEWYDTFYFLARTLAFSNSAINPIIYAGFNENFRKGIKSMCGCYKKPRWTAIARIDSFRSTTLTATSKIFNKKKFSVQETSLIKNNFHESRDHHKMTVAT